jgi:transposase, IS5 family
MMQPGFFDWQNRFEKLDKTGDPLLKLNTAINWEMFLSELEALRNKQRKSNTGAKPYDTVMMFKILIIQSLYNLSDEAVEYQILDRCPLCAFWGCMRETRCLMPRPSGCFVSS